MFEIGPTISRLAAGQSLAVSYVPTLAARILIMAVQVNCDSWCLWSLWFSFMPNEKYPPLCRRAWDRWK